MKSKLVILSLFAVGTAQAQRGLSPEDVAGMRQIQNVRISPDGQWVGLHDLGAEPQGKHQEQRCMAGFRARRHSGATHGESQGGWPAGVVARRPLDRVHFGARGEAAAVANLADRW